MLSLGGLRICLILIVVRQITAVSYNQPKFCPVALWNSTATTFADNNTVGSQPYDVFVNTNNTVYVPNQANGQILIWSKGNNTSPENITGNWSTPFSLFATINGEIYVDNGNLYKRVDKWTFNQSVTVPAMYVCGVCYDLFVSINSTLYCSMRDYHQVIAKSLDSVLNTFAIVAGTGTAGSTWSMLNAPHGIFVDINFDLYVADCGNDRVQLFQLGQSNALTVAGSTAIGTITLSCPIAIVLDADKYLFIADHYNHRIVGSGPNGFQCVVGCSGGWGTAANQLYYPRSLSFDSYGNIYVADQNNNRIQKFTLATNSCEQTTTPPTTMTSTMNLRISTDSIQSTGSFGFTSTVNDVTMSPTEAISYNQPKLDADAVWSTNAITFAGSGTIGTYPWGIFVNTNNNVFLVIPGYNQMLVWLNGSGNPTRTISSGLNSPYSLFVLSNGDIYVDNGYPNGRVDRWTLNANTYVPAMYVAGSCYGLFIDINNVLYCSISGLHRIVTKSLDNPSNMTTIVAGIGCAGSTSYMLSSPHGIFVDINLDLYVADYDNNRIQLFKAGQSNGSTVAGNGAANTTTLSCPTSIALDADKYLFIVDACNHRIVGSGPNGFRCLVGCSGGGSASNQLDYPVSMAFDSAGNLFVSDYWNVRIQKFILLNKTLPPSYNQPTFCPSTTWNPNAITFAQSGIGPLNPYGVFVNINNTIYVSNSATSQILVWSEGNVTPVKTISINYNWPYHLFVTINGDGYVGSGYYNSYSYYGVIKWTANSTGGTWISYLTTNYYGYGDCYGIFVDVSNTLYCSIRSLNEVVKTWLGYSWTTWTIVAGTGTAGSTSSMLNNPHGIFVDINFDLYVADCNNNRVQLFQLGQSNALTVAGSTAIGTITLSCPVAIVLDIDKYLFIVDFSNNRIVGSGPNGFRCVVGCSGGGAAANQLNGPLSLSFDSYGNLYVADQGNNRIQKFIVLNKTLTPSYNQPTFCPSTTWNPNATTLAQSGTTLTLNPYGVFVNTNSTVYVSNYATSQILVWSEGNVTPVRNISINYNWPYHLFVTVNGDGYVGSEYPSPYIVNNLTYYNYYYGVAKWTANSTNDTWINNVDQLCFGIFVDVSNTLYCSVTYYHKVVETWLGDSSTTWTIVAGTGIAGSNSSMLHNPIGIFVDINFDLYVADCNNNRVQLYQSGQSNALTVAGSTAIGTITLSCPTAIVLDADKYLFIVDNGYNRVVGSGPNGFRCVVGCSGGWGAAANQLNDPWSLSFDGYGNLYVADRGNSRIQKFTLATNSCVLSYNQTKFCPDASWNANASTLASSNVVGSSPYGIFINGLNMIYVTSPNNNSIFFWSQESLSPTQMISSSSSQSYSVFATINGDVYIDNGYLNGQVNKWSYQSNSREIVMNTNGVCYGLFVDNNNTLYCSLADFHQVIKVSLISNSTTPTISVGNGSAGSASNMLYSPRGIYVDLNLNLYVADCGNNRIQFFRSGQSNGTTVAVNGVTGSFTLNCPTDIILDSDQYLFIVDNNNHRIIGSGSNGFRCIVGCLGSNVSSSFKLLYPQRMAFDSDGNIFVTDTGNSRIQKFSLQNNFCGQTTSIEQQTSTMMTTTTTTTPIVNPICSLPRISLIPGPSNFSSPLQFRRSQDFSISSDIEFLCNNTYPVTLKWIIRNCSSICSYQMNLNNSVMTTSAELDIPGRTLPYGIYQFQLIVKSIYSPNLTTSSSAYAKINPSGITANLVPLGTSMITRGHQQDLLLDPGSYSVDPDESSFDTTKWKYQYYCRIYGFSNFPNLQGSLLTIDDPRIDPFNPSCLSNRSGKQLNTYLFRKLFSFVNHGNETAWKYKDFIQSSITILGSSLQSNRSYQFMVQMVSRKNASQQATGYVLVKVEDTLPQLIAIGCVIWTLCVPNMEFQLVNPTTQVALFALCIGNCTTLQSIQWNIYYGQMNSSTNYTNWLLYNQTNSNVYSWFFGANTSNFTATNQLFLRNPQNTLWRFEVVYKFVSAKSSSALNFIINTPPANGSCSINPSNGTINTLFSISCPNWFDTDNVKDYLLYSWENDPSKLTIIAYSFVYNFQVRLPVGAFHLIVQIRDTADCVSVYNLSSILIQSDSTIIQNLMNNPAGSDSSSVTQLLSSGTQNIVGQVISSTSQQLNTMNNQSIDQAVSNGIPAASVSVSPLGSSGIPQNLTPLNESAREEYNRNLNSQSNLREYLVSFTNNLPITTPNSIKLQSSTLAQLTGATNQLTRATLSMAMDRCYQLASSLQAFSDRIPYEDAHLAATQLMQCGTNILTAVNGPLQQRTTVLDVDASRATAFPSDYDTDVESEWSNLNLFADGNDFSSETIERGRNIYHQKQLANQITTQVHQMISFLTATLNLHINIGQNSQINTSDVFMSMETLSSKSLSNKTIQPVGNSRIQLPLNFNSNSNDTISLRSMIKPLASFGNSKSQPNTNLSTSISLEMFDQNGNEISPTMNLSNPIEIIIPRDPSLIIPPMILQNVTSLNSTPHNQIFNFHYINITSTFSLSAHIELQPLNTSLAYLFIYKFDSVPQWTQFDGWTIFWPSNLTNESTYTYFIDNQKAAGHQSVLFGIRELNAAEMINLGMNRAFNTLPIITRTLNFTADYAIRLYTSGCYYLDQNNDWKSDNMLVGPETNHYQTQCYLTQLKTIASGFVFLPKSIDWNYVFANADFLKNKTIYFTVISVSIIYLILLIFARYKDKKDLIKLGVTSLPDNHQADQYYYQILVFTGQRKDAGTNSKVHFILGGDNDQTHIRTLADPHRKILQRGGIDAFIMAVPKSLGLLNYIRIWHDNSGKGSSSSWFLKYIIVRDLQTMEKFHFIAQQWFAVEKDDGKIERTLTFASEVERQEFSYLLSKKTYHSVSEGHLWFSIFSRPPSNKFTRVQRCTCAFVLFYLSMFLNIMYYDTTNQTNTNNSTSTSTLSIGPLHIAPQQIIIGVIVEVLSLIPSLLLVQFFRRIRLRQQPISPLRQALYKVKPPPSNEKEIKRKKGLTFPWWCLFLAYGFCLILVVMSIFFIIARGIQFGDLKSQQWLTSILSGFFSSILLTQPIKIICLSIVFALLCRKDNDQEASEYIDENNHDLDDDEDYLHVKEDKSLFTYRPPVRAERLNEAEVACARQHRLKEVYMWSILREIFSYICFLTLLSMIIYSNRSANSFLEVQHLRKYFLNTREMDNNYLEICTIDDYWKWLEESFTSNLRAQQWYNGDIPRNLNGFINDKSNRLIGWATIRQLRIKSDICHSQITRSICAYDYSSFNEDRESYQPGWLNDTTEDYSSSIINSFEYQSSEELDTYVYLGHHGNYEGGGYVYEFRGRLTDIQSNLSMLHQLSWIDNQTRAVLIQLTLYNPNVQLFTSVTFLSEFLSIGSIDSQARFEPIDFYNLRSLSQLICTIFYILFLIYLMFMEIRSLFRLKCNYFRQFWSLIEIGLIACSWSGIGVYVWSYLESNRISSLLKQTNGYVYINLQLSTYVNDLLTFLFGFCCFFGTIKFLRLCRFNQRLTLFGDTLRSAAKELISFAMMFSIVFFSFICLFYLLFNSTLWSCASLLKTAQMLFEMTLLKFDTGELVNAAPALGPVCFSLFILLVVFVCMSMFLSIISDNFRHARDNVAKYKEEVFSFMWDRFQRVTGLKKPTKEEIYEEQDAKMRGQYFDPIEHFPEKVDQLLDSLNRLHMDQRRDLHEDT